MFCPFLKRTNYSDKNHHYIEKNRAEIQREYFCECEKSECMAYDPDPFGRPHCKLIEKKN